jgi:adenylate cyclase
MEIERKFLVKNTDWKTGIKNSVAISQIYLTTPNQAPTVRLRTRGEQAFLTLKYPSVSKHVLARDEYEYEIPLADVKAQLHRAKGNQIQKIRHLVTDEFDQKWEIDEFHCPNKGLILAEIELTSQTQEVNLPNWAGKEVTADDRYSNINMAFSEDQNL